jgi:hypothetical protein
MWIYTSAQPYTFMTTAVTLPFLHKLKLNKTVVLYGCETWSLTLREEHRLRVFENGTEEDIWTEEG